MTDKQLAILLNQYRNQLVIIFNQLLDDLKDNPGLKYHTIQQKGKWIGKGKEPIFNLFAAYTDWEWIEIVGNPTCLDELSSFIDELNCDINTLLDEND